jgi:hypothetical protein
MEALLEQKRHLRAEACLGGGIVLGGSIVVNLAPSRAWSRAEASMARL